MTTLCCGAHVCILSLVHNQSCGSLSYSGSLSLPHRLWPNCVSQIETLNPLLWFPNISWTGSPVCDSASESPYRTSLCLLVSDVLSCLESLLPFQDWHTANSLPLCPCPLFTNILPFGGKRLLLNALSPFSFVSHGMKFLDGTKSLLEMYQLEKLIMILIKTPTVIY